MEEFYSKIPSYYHLTEEVKDAFTSISRQRSIRKNEYFVTEGSIPRTVAFVRSGLLAQYFISSDAEVVIKKFFPENHFMASLSSLISGGPSIFSIKALEASIIIEFSFADFKKLTETYREVSSMYINYLERHWVVEKEPSEVSLRNDNATIRYLEFLRNYPGLQQRLKQHEIASFLGITPTQLSRIRAELRYN